MTVVLLAFLTAQTASAPTLHLKGNSFIPTENKTPGSQRELSTQSKHPNNHQERYMLLQFKEPVTEDYRNEISAKGIKFISYIPENTWIVKSGTSERNLISENKVRALMPYKPEFRIEPHLKRDANKKSGKVDVHVELFESVSNPENLLERYGDIRGRFRKDTWKIETNYSQISRISREKKVKWIEPEPPEYETQNDDSRRLIEAESLQESPYNLKGTDFTAGIWDGGEVGKHEDLNYSGKLILGEESSVSDHAVHVAGTMLGAGKISSTYRGIAPETRVVSYDFSYSFASELYNEINESINKYDSILSQNSWGWVIDDNNEDLMGNYQGAAYDYDAIVSGETSDVSGRIPVIFSAGNEGDRTPRYNTTTGPGGTAKNTITVGAVDDSGNMNSFSSWGPTDDGRIKPTLVAAGGGNGDVVTSTYPTGSGFYPYAGLTGTSMSAPAVSGATILLTERFNDTHNTLPKPATVKATLIHTAEDLGREGPDYKYGWGLVNTTAAVNYIDETDKRNLIRRGSLSQGESNSYSILVPENKNISFTLVWSDYPGTSGSGKALINDLDLVVKNGENERKYPYTLSWENRTNPALQTQEDHTNPLEQVHVEDTNTTEYSVTVEGYDVPEAPQDYTLLMTSEDADTTSPNLTIESPENITYSRIPDFNISSNQSLESANYSIDRQQNYSMKQKNNTYFYNNTAEITDGHHEAVFWGENNFGNSSSENIFFTLDTQKPTVNPRNPKNKSKISESFNINLTYSDSLSGVDDINVSLENTSGIITSFSGNKTLNSDNYADGEYKIIFQVNDTAGNTEKKTLNITLDNTPPKINTLKPEKNEQVFPPFDILAEVKDSTGIVRRDFEISNSSGIQTSGSFNATNIGSNLLNGNYNASLETEDKAGNTQNKTIKFSISDEVNLTVKSPENRTYGEIPDFNLSSNVSMSSTKYSIDSQDNYSMIKETDQLFYNTSAEVENGSQMVRFWTNDSTGEWYSVNLSFTVDTEKPSVTPKSPLMDSNISGVFDIKATWSDTYTEVVKYNFSLKNSTYSEDGVLNSTKDSNNLADGEYTLYYNATDAAGNKKVKTRTATIDNSKPDLSIHNPANQSNLKDKFDVNLSYSDSVTSVEDVNISLKNSTGLIKSFTGNETLNSNNYADGEYKIKFSLNDSAGNLREKILEITLDNTPPNMDVVSPEATKTVSLPFNVSAAVTDLTDVVRRDFEISNSSGIQTSGSFNATNIGSNLLNGNYNASLETEDKAGNTQNKTIKFSISEEINLTIKSPENKTYSQTPDFNLSTNKSVSDAKYSVDNQGNYSLIKKNSSFFYNTSSKIGNGTHRAVFWANDSAGKWFSEDILFTLDDDKPSLTPKNPVEGENISDEFSIDAEWSDSFTTVENHDYTLSNGTSVKTGALNDTLDSHDFKDGDYKVYFNVTDSAGNTMIRSRSITLDNTDPNLQVKSPSDNSIVSRPFDIEAVFSDAGGVKKAIFNLSNKSGVVISDDLNSTLGSSEVSKGDYNISYEIEDFAGNSITSNISVKVSSSPNITLESPLNKTYKAVPDFNLSSKQEISSAVVEISNNNRSLKRKNDTYYYNNSLDLDDGRYEAISYANNTEDLFSNTSISFTIDTVPPSADVNLNSNSNFSSDFDVNATVEDSVSGVNKSTFQVFNSTGNQTPVRELNGTVEVSKLIDGEYNLSFNFTDNAGNYNDSLNLSFKLDREDPGISINSPTSDVLSGSFEVNFSARDELTRLADSGFVLSNSSNSSIVSGSFNTSIDTTGYADGNYTLNFSAEDLAGNLNSSSLELKFDNTEPIIQLLSPSGKNLSESVDVEAAFNDSDLVKKRYRWLKDGSNVTSWTELNDSDFDTESLEDGSYEITVEAEDKAGNSVSENFDFTIDNTAPEINLAKQGFENLSSKWVASGFTLESTCTDDTTGLNTHEYDFDGATKTTSNSSVDISFTGSGLNSASFTCIDYAGNENSSSLVKWLDSGPPRVESAMPLNGSDSVDRSFDLSATLHDEESESGVDVNASNLSIDSGSIEDINWSNDSFTANISDLDYATTFTVTGEIKDYAGQVHSVNLEYTTKSDPDSDDDSGGGGGGGGGGISIPSDTENQKKSEKSEEETPEMKVKRSENSVEVSYLDLEESWQEVDVSEMKTALSSVNVTGSGVANFSAKEVEKDPDPPNNTEIYNSLEMDVTSTGEVSAEASFLVSRSWLESKDLRPEKTSLYRKSSSGWEKLPTVIEDVGRNAFKYSSEIPDFSIFTVATEREKCVKKNYSVVRNGECSTVYKCEAPEDELVESCSSYESAKSSNSTNNNASLTAKMQVPDVGIPNTKYLKTALIFLAVLAILSIAGYLAYKWYEKHELKESLEEIKKISGKDPELIYNIDQTELAIEEGEYDKAAKMMTEIKEMIAEGQKS